MIDNNNNNKKPFDYRVRSRAVLYLSSINYSFFHFNGIGKLFLQNKYLNEGNGRKMILPDSPNFISP